ncbi:MAG: rhomboid family intramembrane serine protease [Chloroflexi bacterium]|nr:rhomboid family intramembrane serine protease [Chloroflexota bacterium]
MPWTIVTNLFIHAPFPAIWHVAGNMLTLYFFGSYLIQLIGERYFLIIYFVGGLVGNIFFMLLASPFSTAIGASGAVFAVGGALTVLRPKLPVFIFPIPVPIPLWVAVIGGFLIISPGIAWQAHLGGLLLGLMVGYFFRRQRRFI